MLREFYYFILLFYFLFLPLNSRILNNLTGLKFAPPPHSFFNIFFAEARVIVK